MPKLRLLSSATGAPKFTELKILKNSARNCSLPQRSEIGTPFTSEISVLADAGPLNTLRPKLP